MTNLVAACWLATWYAKACMRSLHACMEVASNSRNNVDQHNKKTCPHTQADKNSSNTEVKSSLMVFDTVLFITRLVKSNTEYLMWCNPLLYQRALSPINNGSYTPVCTRKYAVLEGRNDHSAKNSTAYENQITMY